MNPIDFSAEKHIGTRVLKPEHITKADYKADVVIIGSGPGGLTAATVFAEAGASVIVIEAGKFWKRGSFKRRQSWALENLYQDRGTRIALGNCFIPVLSGRGVGGGTIVNSGICFRAPDRILDEWAENSGIEFWSNRNALYEEVEKTIGYGVTSPSIAGKNTMVARRGFEAMNGVKHDYMPRNTPGCTGCGACPTGCPSSGKASSDLTWLPRALKHDTTLFTQTKVTHIKMDGKRAVGVEAVTWDDDGQEKSIVVNAGKVVVAAGAINSPTLLQAQSLANLSGMVGENLRIQPGVGVIAEFEEEIRIWSGATQGYYAYHPTEKEILAETFSAPPEAFFTQAGVVGVGAAKFFRSLKNIAGAGVLIRDSSSGSVSADDTGKINISYNINEDDHRKFTLGHEFICEMFFAAGAKKVRPMIAGASMFTSFNHTRQFVRSRRNIADYDVYASHPMSTCQMGADPKTSVVRPTDGRTHDHEGLYIMDSSVLPTSMGVNPQMTIMGTVLATAREAVKQG